MGSRWASISFTGWGIMSDWTFSDVFEEQGVVKTPFYGGYGLIAAGSIPKPAFQAFKLLHKLGDQIIPLQEDSALATRNKDGSYTLALWNYAPPEGAGSAKTVTVRFQNIKAKQALVTKLDEDHGNVLAAYKKLGSPRYPTQAQLQTLRAASQLSAPEKHEVKNAELSLTIPSQGLVLVELK